MQGGHCTCLPKALKVSGVYLHILTVVGKASEAFFVGHTHEYKRMLDSTMHRGVVFSIARASIDTLTTSHCLLEACRACVGRAQRKSTVHELCTAHSACRRKKKRGSHKPRRTYDNWGEPERAPH